MPRKTVEVEKMRRSVNHLLATDKRSPDFREGVKSLAEHLLAQAGQYRGFRYLTADEVPDGELPGIAHGGADGLQFPDESRVAYL